MRTVLLSVILVVGLGLMGAVWSSVTVPVHGKDSPWSHIAPKKDAFNHKHFFDAPLKTGPEVTRACVKCHQGKAEEVQRSEHFAWLGKRVAIPGTDKQLRIGKLNLLNNFCIHAMPNIGECSRCHAGYNWEEADPKWLETGDAALRDPMNVDCLVCHDASNTYVKGDAGNPDPSVDLAAAARSVGPPPGRKNCGVCHFEGGGGDGVKHGDLDGTMYNPTARLDVHMGQHGFQCVDCHKTSHHNISGCAISVSIDRPKEHRVSCEQCHGARPHDRERLNDHTKSVACETCHIPRVAVDLPTQMVWDLSTGGSDELDQREAARLKAAGIDEKYHYMTYMKSKGTFTSAMNVRPSYRWYNGKTARYLVGDKIDPALFVDKIDLTKNADVLETTRPVRINFPLGDARDPAAKIYPFKIHYQVQPFDKEHLWLLTPKNWGPGGYWREFDWPKALTLGSEVTGLPFSGKYGFVRSEMYWQQNHMVQTKDRALQCVDCHSKNGVLDWEQLGYEGDPAFRGDRWRQGLVRDQRGGNR